MKLEILGYKKYKTLDDISHNGVVVCPKEFKFDITVPKAIWFILNGLMFSKVVRAVATHDYEYTNKNNPRNVADKQLREMLIADSVHPALAWIAFFGARAVGWYYWNKAS